MDKYSYSQRTLSNNLRVLHIPIETTEMVHISLLGKGGKRAEKENEVGAAHFLEHLFFDGTKNRPSSFELNKFVDEQGSGHNGTTHTNEVEYFVKILADKAEYAFDYLSDIALNSLLRDKDIEKERKVISEEITMKADNPLDILTEGQLALLYPNQIIGRKRLKEKENLPNINSGILKEFYKRNYVANNFVLAVAGSIENEKAFLLAEKYFNTFPRGEEIQFTVARIEKEHRVEIIKKNFDQSRFSINFSGYPMFSAGQMRASLLARILSGGFSSRLYERLRTQKHLIYSVHTNAFAFTDGGYFCIESSTGEEKLQEAISEIFGEIKKLLEEGIDNDELKKAKNINLFGFLSGIESISSYTNYFTDQLLFKKGIKGIEERINEIKSVTGEELMETAKYIFSDKPKICVLAKNLSKLEVDF